MDHSPQLDPTAPRPERLTHSTAEHHLCLRCLHGAQYEWPRNPRRPVPKSCPSCGSTGWNTRPRTRTEKTRGRPVSREAAAGINAKLKLKVDGKWMWVWTPERLADLERQELHQMLDRQLARRERMAKGWRISQQRGTPLVHGDVPIPRYLQLTQWGTGILIENAAEQEVAKQVVAHVVEEGTRMAQRSVLGKIVKRMGSAPADVDDTYGDPGDTVDRQPHMQGLRPRPTPPAPIDTRRGNVDDTDSGSGSRRDDVDHAPRVEPMEAAPPAQVVERPPDTPRTTLPELPPARVIAPATTRGPLPPPPRMTLSDRFGDVLPPPPRNMPEPPREPPQPERTTRMTAPPPPPALAPPEWDPSARWEAERQEEIERTAPE